MTQTETIKHFYESFKNKDHVNMQLQYAAEATFSDPIFVHLNHKELIAMWEMFCKNGRDLSISYKNIVALDRSTVTAEWTAYYTFSLTKRKIINSIKSTFYFDTNGKIIQHKDSFDLNHWVYQAFNYPKWIILLFPFIKSTIRKKAMAALHLFIEK